MNFAFHCYRAVAEIKKEMYEEKLKRHSVYKGNQFLAQILGASQEKMNTPVFKL